MEDASQRAGYREPARPGRTGPLEPPCQQGAWRSAVALGSVAISGAAGAVVGGSVELAVLGGAGALAAAAHWARAWGARRRHRHLARFLGADAVVEGPGTWTTPDGRRRLRAVPGDELVRFECLDPVRGVTLESFRGASPVRPVPVEPGVIVERVVATVHGRPIDPRCFRGLPPQLGGRFARLAEVREVALEVRREGVLLERFDADGQLSGDTWHADVQAALRQLDGELGGHLGRWRDPELEPRGPERPASPSWDGPLDSRVRL
ncbi:MAG TPA: hypothetical protein RMH99_23225 [Sandaracinaceae bacterium LLY-WYZ-13_1]|nr:hypothetical protein [Sandaracinaceae bacterium LLY-WYZ-13_1]